MDKANQERSLRADDDDNVVVLDVTSPTTSNNTLSLTRTINDPNHQLSFVTPTERVVHRRSPTIINNKPPIVDLTKNEVEPLFLIRNKNPLFYSYDPRGESKTICKSNPMIYCQYCRCPAQYCADLVIGCLSAKHSLYKMNDDNIQDYSDEDDVTAVFLEVYT